MQVIIFTESNITFLKVIEHLRDENLIDLMIKQFEDVLYDEKKSLLPNAASFSIVIGGLMKNGQKEKAKQLFEEMGKMVYELTVTSTYL